MPFHLMWVTDGPFSGTGFCEESRHILFRLAQKGFKISWLGLQHIGSKVVLKDEMFPDLPQEGASIQVLSNFGYDPFGASGLLYWYPKEVPDLVMFMGDSNRTGAYGGVCSRIPFPFGIYVTLDGLPIHPIMVKDLDSKLFDFVVTMTQWAMLEYAKVGIQSVPIHHGTNCEFWKPKEDEKLELRKKYHIPEGAMVYISWDVNQYRKRLDALLRCWKRFKPETKNAYLILNTDWKCELGWDLETLITQYNIPRKTILSPEQLTGFPKKIQVAEPISELREIAMLGDIYVTTSGGEGFGKCSKDAQACGMPVIATEYSAIPEVVEDGGVIVPITGTIRLHDKVKAVELGIVDESKFTEAMLDLYRHSAEREGLAKLALVSAARFNYDSQIIPIWEKFLNGINPDEVLAKKVLKR